MLRSAIKRIFSQKKKTKTKSDSENGEKRKKKSKKKSDSEKKSEKSSSKSDKLSAPPVRIIKINRVITQQHLASSSQTNFSNAVTVSVSLQ